MIKIVVGCNVDLEFLDECKNNSNLTTYVLVKPRNNKGYRKVTNKLSFNKQTSKSEKW